MVINEDVLKGKWHLLKGKAKEQWGRITDDEWKQVEGSAEQIVGQIQKSYGYSRAHAEEELKKWLDSCENK